MSSIRDRLGLSNQNNSTISSNNSSSTIRKNLGLENIDFSKQEQTNIAVPQTTISTTTGIKNEDGYTDIGKTYGDYWYQNYSKNKDKKIYEKDGQYYVNMGSYYQNVDQMNFMATKEGDEKSYQDAVALGFKGSKSSLTKMSDRIKLDTSNLSNKEYEEYEDDLLRQQEAKEAESKHDNRIKYGDALGKLQTAFENAKYNISKEIVNPIKNFEDNYESGKLNNQLALEYYKKMNGQENKVDELTEQVQKYNMFNQDLLTDPGMVGTAIQNLNTQVESLKNQGIAATALSGLGAGVGYLFGGTPGALAGAKTGGGLGYTLGATPYTYKLEAGNQYQTLTELGVPDDVAKKYSVLTGGANALIESGENIVDLITFGIGGKTSQAVSKEAVDSMVKDYGENTVKKWLTKKIGAENAEKIIKATTVAGTSYLQNIGSEALEEMAQEGTSILGERLSTNEANIDRNISLKDDINRVLEAGKSAAISTAFTAPISSASGALITNTMNAAINKNSNAAKKTDASNIQNSQQNNLDTTKYSETGNENKYKYIASDNQKSNALKQSASNYFDNSTQTINLINTMDKVIQDKGYNILFDNTITNTNGQSVNAQIKTLDNGEVEIRINPNSPRAGEFLLCHEITHAIETDSMKQLVMDYASKNVEFNQALESLKQTYGTNEITSEVLADISGQLFGNQEFINNLSMQQPNVFKRIYNKIIELANKITGNSNEALFIKDLKNKWDTAYRTQNNNLNNGTKFSTIGLNGANNLEKYSDSRYYKNLNKRQKIASKIFENSNLGLEDTNIKTKQETGWFQTEYGDWGTLISDKNSRLTQKLEPNRTYLLGDILEHELLYQAYPELKKLKVRTSDIDSTGGYASLPLLPANTITNEIYIRNSDLNKRDFRKTLLHEINHYIEHKENYDKRSIGASSKIDGKEGYRNNLGELISNETKINADLTQEELDAIILPEQAKKNPQYKNIREKLLESNKNDLLKNGDDNSALQNLELPIQNKIKNNKVANKKDNKSRRIVNDMEELDNSSFSYDNQGRTLTKEQQDYFKDSKVRDENGNLLTVYHGTRNNFTVFDIEKAGQSNGLESKAGFWFTESENGAKQFSNEVWYGENENAKAIETYLNLKNPKIYEKVDNSQKISDIKFQKKEISSQLGKYYDKYNVTFDIITNQPEQNTFNDISRYTSLSENELKRTIKEWAKADNVNEYYDDVIKYRNLIEQQRMLEKQLSDLRYIDSYEQFRSDIYKTAGKSPTDANFGGTGMALDNNEEVMRQYIANLKKQGYDGIIIKETNYDNNRFGENNNQYVAFYSNQIKNVDNVNPTSNEDIRYSQQDNTWQEHLEKNYKATGTRTDMRTLKGDVLPKSNKTQENNVVQENKNNSKKVLNPLEISKLTQEDANTTPKLPTAKVSTGEGKSKFASNIENKTDMLSDDSKHSILSSEEVNYYKEVTNEESLNKALERLNKNGKSETERWFAQKSENATSVDVAEGWILLKQYQDSIEKAADLSTKNDLNRSMVEVAKKLREMGTTAGQTVQAFNILSRLTPEGMVYYAQSELQEAYENMSKNKTKEWIDSHRDKFDLTPQETQFIMDTMQEVQQMEDGYDKRVKLAEIQKVMTDKLPPTKGSGIKSWMRISMLFNPKTQVRNVTGNALIAPVNAFSDLFASSVDKMIAKKTGVRTTGKTNLKSYGKGFKTGLYQSYNDFKKGINTRNIQGNRFELTEGRSFNNDKLIGKGLNRVDSLLSFMLDAGDRGFYEASFTNSINNQMILNNTNEITQDMIDIATQEALSRTWQDNNNYTKAVLGIRKLLNFNKNYGLGDVLIPFAKTPANLTKAIIDYSPVGMVNTITSGINLKRSLTNGQYNAQMQHKFVQNLGKATAGSMLYILGYALAKAGIISGESDDDKDVKNFLQNTLGVSSYSIKIGDKSFTYDWAQPIAAPLSIMANIVNSDKNKGTALTEAIVSSLDSAGSILLEQSFLQSINDVLNNNDGVVSGLITEVLELPARAIPTLSKQIADIVDGTQRQTFEYDQPLKSALNYGISKIPGLSKTLAPSVDTMGREIQKYGGKNNIFNVFINPANVNTENISESAEEIYRLYKETGETDIMPRVAPYYINQSGEKITLSSTQRAEYQKISGSIIEDNVRLLMNNSTYKKMSDEEKANVINNIVNYSYNKAREEVLGIEMSDQYNAINKWLQCGGSLNEYYVSKDEVTKIKEQYAGSDKTNVRKQKIFQYINGLDCSKNQRIILFNILGGYSIKDYQSSVHNYINKLNISKSEKEEIWKYLYGN